jgi:hypothetical protein
VKSTSAQPSAKSERAVAKAKADRDREYESKSVPVEEFPELVEAGIPELAVRSRELAVIIAEAEEERKAINAEIKSAMIEAGAESIKSEEDDWCAVRAEGHGPAKISPELLLKNGVSMKVIERSTEPGGTYEYVQVRKLTS